MQRIALTYGAVLLCHQLTAYQAHKLLEMMVRVIQRIVAVADSAVD